VRAAGILAIAGTLLAHGSSASAQAPADPSTPLRITFARLTCLEETNEWSSSDEPYVVMFVADLSGTSPTSYVKYTQIFPDVDKNETHWASLPIWWTYGFADHGAPIASPDDVIILVALMESDGSDLQPLTIRNGLGDPGNMLFQLNRYWSDYQAKRLSHAEVASRLKSHMERQIDNNYKDGDDRIGPVQELRLTSASLQSARAGTMHTFRLSFFGDWGLYELFFEMNRYGGTGSSSSGLTSNGGSGGSGGGGGASPSPGTHTQLN
jgi:uncharacterized membrane protein YgcG